MTGTDLCVNMYKSVPVIFEPLTMHGPIKVKSPNNTIKWQMGFNLAFKGLNKLSIRHMKLNKYIHKHHVTLYINLDE
jgi:hypothetical protein